MKKFWKAIPTLRPTARDAWFDLERLVVRENIKGRLRETPELKSKTLRFLIGKSLKRI